MINKINTLAIDPRHGNPLYLAMLSFGARLQALSLYRQHCLLQLRTSAVIVAQWVRSFSERGLYILARMCERLFLFPSRVSTYISTCHLICPMRAAVLNTCLHDGSNY